MWVDNISGEKGRWYRLQVRGSAQDGFQVEQDDLFLKVEFFKNRRQDSLDSIKTRIFAQVERERADLGDQGLASVFPSTSLPPRSGWADSSRSEPSLWPFGGRRPIDLCCRPWLANSVACRGRRWPWPSQPASPNSLAAKYH